MSTEILRYAAFTDRPEGGNPAGVVLDASGLDDAAMQAIAADVGYSETAFVTAADGSDLVVRYFSPLAEVPFCGHATIATGVAWGDRFGDGLLKLTTPAGLVEVDVADGVAKLTSVAPSSAELGDADLDELLAALRWTRSDLDPSIPPRVAYAGAHHPVLAAAASERLAELDYDFDRLARADGRPRLDDDPARPPRGPRPLPLPQPVPARRRRRGPGHGRRGRGVRRLPARARRSSTSPATVTIDQGIELGRPSLLTVDDPARDGGISRQPAPPCRSESQLRLGQRQRGVSSRSAAPRKATAASAADASQSTRVCARACR